ELEHLLGAGRERDVAGRGRVTPADQLLHVPPDLRQREPQPGQRLAGDALRVPEQRQQDVFGAYVVVLERTGFLFREYDGLSCPLSESLEHAFIITTLSIPYY